MPCGQPSSTLSNRRHQQHPAVTDVDTPRPMRSGCSSAMRTSQQVEQHVTRGAPHRLIDEGEEMQ